MPGSVTVTESNRIIDATFGTAAYTAPTGPIKTRLMTVNGSASATGTEVVGGSYTPATITMASAAAESAASNLLARYNGMPAAVVAGIEVWDSAGSPRRIWWATLPTVTASVVAATDVFTANGHGMANNDAVQFYGSAPTGLTANTVYYVINTAANTFKLAATVGGASVDVTADGSGYAVIKCKTVVAGDAFEIGVGALVAGLV